jgi:putative membrane protein
MLGACGGDSSTNETTTTDSLNSTMDGGDAANNQSNSMGSSSNTMADSNKMSQDFINYAVQKNTTEIAWLMAGKSKGTSKELKSHAEMMLRDHRKLEATVKGYLAKHPNITAPAADTTGAVNLTEPKGEAWDKAFTQKMVTEHEDLIARLNEAEGNLVEAELKKIATDAKPVVQSHLDMLKGMQGKMKYSNSFR